MADMPASLAQVYCSAPVTVLLWPHTTQGANLAENEHSGKIQQNPHLANTAFIVPCMLWKSMKEINTYACHVETQNIKEHHFHL